MSIESHAENKKLIPKLSDTESNFKTLSNSKKCFKDHLHGLSPFFSTYCLGKEMKQPTEKPQKVGRKVVKKMLERINVGYPEKFGVYYPKKYSDPLTIGSYIHGRRQGDNY